MAGYRYKAPVNFNRFPVLNTRTVIVRNNFISQPRQKCCGGSFWGGNSLMNMAGFSMVLGGLFSSIGNLFGGRSAQQNTYASQQLPYSPMMYNQNTSYYNNFSSMLDKLTAKVENLEKMLEDNGNKEITLEGDLDGDGKLSALEKANQSIINAGLKTEDGITAKEKDGEIKFYYNGKEFDSIKDAISAKDADKKPVVVDDKTKSVDSANKEFKFGDGEGFKLNANGSFNCKFGGFDLNGEDLDALKARVKELMETFGKDENKIKDGKELICNDDKMPTEDIKGSLSNVKGEGIIPSDLTINDSRRGNSYNYQITGATYKNKNSEFDGYPIYRCTGSKVNGNDKEYSEGNLYVLVAPNQMVQFEDMEGWGKNVGKA